MRPFNLEAAINGEPLITRAGTPAKFIQYDATGKQHRFGLPVCVEVDGYQHWYTEDGKFLCGNIQNAKDLFIDDGYSREDHNPYPDE